MTDNKVMYLKGVGGDGDNKVLTLASGENEWLNYTASWTKMPTISLATESGTSFSLRVRYQNQVVGDQKFFIRLRDEEKSKNYDSEKITLLVLAPTPTSTSTPTPTPTTTLTPTSTPTVILTSTKTLTPTSTPSVTKTLTPTRTPTLTKTPTPTKKPTVTPKQTKTPTPKMTTKNKPTDEQGQVLGSTEEKIVNQNDDQSDLAKIFQLTGVLFGVASVITFLLYQFGEKITNIFNH